MSKGTYGLGVELTTDSLIAIGALGEIQFDAGGYVYVGSAFGPGGFARVDRHRELATGARDARHWHIDYLLANPTTELIQVGKTAGADRECSIAQALPGTPVAEFGASDCDCSSHLIAVPRDRTLQSVLSEQYETIESA